MNGKTIEIINTDCEGRLVLADALWYAREQGATHLVDMATLTGAMVLAMGDLYAGVYANDDGWRDSDRRRRQRGRRPPLAAAAAPPLPALRELELRRHEERLDPQGGARRRSPPSSCGSSPATGPWAHIDLAGPAFIRRSRGDYLSQQGGTGYGVRLIAELAARLAA